MNETEIMKILEDTAYIRTSGTAEELCCAEYIQSVAAGFGQKTELQPFPVPMAKIHTAELTVDGVTIPCKGYMCAGSGKVEGPLYYLRSTDPYSLSQCKGKIVLMDGYVGYWKYQDILSSGAVGFISYNGNVTFPDRDIDQRELRFHVPNGDRMPGVNIHVSDAVELIRWGAGNARISVQQEEWTGESRNVILDLPGDVPQYIALTAHYDSTPLSKGVYDNMSGCVCLLSLAKYFSQIPHHYGLRFIWCGSEERGLLGSKFYCSDENRIRDCVLNINIDLFGCVMGKFLACVSAEEKLCSYISYLAAETGFSLETIQDVYSSDSTPFADAGVPALSFSRMAPNNTATYHNRYDTLDVVSGRQMVEDIHFVRKFTERMANAVICPVSREIPESVREKLDIYLGIKRGKH